MDSLANRSMRTQDVYVGKFPRFIRGGKRHLVSLSGAQQVCTLDLLNCLSKIPTHERAHTHVRTRPRKVTYSFKQVGHSRQRILGGVVPVDVVH